MIRGQGNPFPTGRDSTKLADDQIKGNQPGFSFRFSVDKTAITFGAPIFFNTLLGDFDVPTDKDNGIAYLRIKPQNGTPENLALRRLASAAEDGLIQGGTRQLSFDDVFSDGGSVWIGNVDVDFLAPDEPYTAFDFAELSTTALIPKVIGDFEDDGDVDAHDYSLWRQTFGTSDAATDANGNGVVDAADYTVWRDSLAVGLAASKTAVPEPTSALLLALATLTSLVLRRR